MDQLKGRVIGEQCLPYGTEQRPYDKGKNGLKPLAGEDASVHFLVKFFRTALGSLESVFQGPVYDPPELFKVELQV